MAKANELAGILGSWLGSMAAQLAALVIAPFVHLVSKKLSIPYPPDDRMEELRAAVKGVGDEVKGVADEVKALREVLADCPAREITVQVVYPRPCSRCRREHADSAD